jgi:hypothetical protein
MIALSCAGERPSADVVFCGKVSLIGKPSFRRSSGTLANFAYQPAEVPAVKSSALLIASHVCANGYDTAFLKETEQ